MKKSEIRTGKIYTNRKGGVREVLDLGPQYVLYSAQREKNNLQYKVLAKQGGPHKLGSVCNSTVASFASWAQAEIVGVTVKF